MTETPNHFYQAKVNLCDIKAVVVRNNINALFTYLDKKGSNLWPSLTSQVVYLFNISPSK